MKELKQLLQNLGLMALAGYSINRIAAYTVAILLTFFVMPTVSPWISDIYKTYRAHILEVIKLEQQSEATRLWTEVKRLNSENTKFREIYQKQNADYQDVTKTLVKVKEEKHRLTQEVLKQRKELADLKEIKNNCAKLAGMVNESIQRERELRVQAVPQRDCSQKESLKQRLQTCASEADGRESMVISSLHSILNYPNNNRYRMCKPLYDKYISVAKQCF